MWQAFHRALLSISRSKCKLHTLATSSDAPPRFTAKPISSALLRHARTELSSVLVSVNAGHKTYLLHPHHHCTGPAVVAKRMHMGLALLICGIYLPGKHPFGVFVFPNKRDLSALSQAYGRRTPPLPLQTACLASWAALWARVQPARSGGLEA